VVGAAIATVGTQSVAAIIGFVILASGKYHVQLHLHDLKPDWAYIKRAFRLGLPASIEQSGRALGLTVMTFLITSFGTLSVAAYGVGSSVLQVVMIPAMGLSMAISALVGQNIGAGNIPRAARIARLGSLLGFGALELIGIVVFLFADSFIAFFVPNDQRVIVAGGDFLRIMALSWGFMGMQFSLTGVLRASGNMVVTMMLTLVSQWVLQFPLAYVLSKHTSLGIDGVWWAIPIANVATTAITLIIFARGDWKKGRLVEPMSDDQLTERSYDEAYGEEVPRI
jgi:putative MATE family efflux protein